MTVIEEIAAERQRQIGMEGWTPEHDDRHKDGSLACAAARYAGHAAAYARLAGQVDEAAYRKTELGNSYHWPWSWQWWKPKNPRRDLIRAAALIVAEIERLDRALPS